MAVHFKFRSAVAFDSVSVEGSGITVASLKDKIIEQKNLGRSANFDLIITNAESGEEYTEDTILVPENTSVIIKRVPAKLSKTLLLVNEPEESRLEDDALDRPPSCSTDKITDLAQLALTAHIDELYDMDDFGVDLYAIDESALTYVETDETSNVSCFLTKNLLDVKRSSQQNGSGHGHGKDGFDKGLARGPDYKAIPHAGYICHRCGLAGHFIQHCPTNGDPAFDMRESGLKADKENTSGSPVVSKPTYSVIVTDAYPLPPELQCSLCQKIFKEAVMIPCCQYSFCNSCAKQHLVEKGCCPQCSSKRFKIDDLLPNVALWQAIERFTSTVPDTAVCNEGADVESATKAAKVVSSATQQHPTSSVVKDVTSMVMVENQPDAPVVDDSVCESVIGSKENTVHESSKAMPLFGESSSVGKKKRQSFPRPSIPEMLSEHTTGKSRKANKYCFVCGSPDHIARNCTANSGDNSTCFPTQLGVFRPLGAVPPRVMNPFGPEMFWPSPMAYGATALPVAPYTPMPYGATALPIGPYGVSSFTPPMYPNPQMHGFLNNIPGRILPPGERPLSREEFMELQERERKRRLAQERWERERAALSGAESEQFVSSDSEYSLHGQRSAANKPVDFNFSKETGSSKNKQKHRRRYANERLQEYVGNKSSEEDPAYDDFKGPLLYSQRNHQDIKPLQSEMKKTDKLSDYSLRSDHEECQRARFWGLKEGAQLKLSKHVSCGRMDGQFEKHAHKSYVKHDGTRVSEANAAEILRSSRLSSKRTGLEGARVICSSQFMEIPTEIKDRHNHQGLVSDDANGFETADEPSSHKHHMESTPGMLDISVDGARKKKRRKHKKRKFNEAKGVSNEDAMMEVAYKKLSKKHKCHYTLSPVDRNSADHLTALDDIEGSRWQMYVGLGGESKELRNSFKEQFKHKHHRSTKSALQKP